jgi:hypothetical protein
VNRIRNVKQFLAKREREMWEREYERDSLLGPITGYQLFLMGRYSRDLYDLITNPERIAALDRAQKELDRVINSAYGKSIPVEIYTPET